MRTEDAIRDEGRQRRAERRSEGNAVCQGEVDELVVRVEIVDERVKNLEEWKAAPIPPWPFARYAPLT